MTPREMALRLVARFRRDRLSRELAAEFEAHVEFLTRDLIHEGMAPEEARLAARRRLGNTIVLRESSRDAWGFPRLENILQDIR